MRHKYTDHAIFITVRIVLFPDKKSARTTITDKFLGGRTEIKSYKFITKE